MKYELCVKLMALLRCLIPLQRLLKLNRNKLQALREFYGKIVTTKILRNVIPICYKLN